MVELQADVKRCGNKAFDGKRIWVCCLRRRHQGDCFAPRWSVERPFLFDEDWTVIFEDDYVAPAPPVAAPPPAVPVHATSSVRDYEGRRPKRKHRRGVYAAPGSGVRSAVRWSGYERDYPSTDDLDKVSMSW